MQEETISLFPQQQRVMNALQAFVRRKESKVFILTGYAGTGKTTLLRVFVEWLEEENYTNAADNFDSDLEKPSGMRYVALASTGRAAKVLSNKIGVSASTVHSHIYSFKGFNKDLEQMAQRIDKEVGVDNTGQLHLVFSFEPIASQAPTIYIVDEASMISDTRTQRPIQAEYGTGRLLCDLLNYNPQGKFIFVGDDCQLPPVDGGFSPALKADYLKSRYHLPVEKGTLTSIVRQGSNNDIILAAERMRRLCANPPDVKWGHFPMKGYQHIRLLGSQIELIDQYVKEVKANGYNATTLITRSNSSCTTLSHFLRKQLGFNEPRVMADELLLVTQNNLIVPLMNGDLVKVKSTGNRRRRANLTFLEVEVEDMATGAVYSTMLIENLLYTKAINLNQEEQKRLFIDFYKREKERGIKQKDEQFEKDLMSDPYLNALRAVYGYAITCHKAQGGEWKKVYLDIPRGISYCPKAEAYQWLYTAMTRASETLYVVNDFFIG